MAIEALQENIRLILLHDSYADRRVLEPLNLNLPRFFMLHHIEENPGLNFALLSRLTLTDRASASRMVRSMELSGLIRRELDQSDRRNYALYLTERGRRLLFRAREAYAVDLAARFGDLSSDELTLLTALAARLVQSYRRHQGEVAG